MFWWIEDRVLAGCHNPTDSELSEMIRDGVTTVISLLDEREQKPGYGTGHFTGGVCTHLSIPVPDFGVPQQVQVEEFLRAVEEGLHRGVVLVHCQGGSGRTGTMGALWLTAGRGISPVRALAAIRDANPSAVETAQQEALVVHWNEFHGSQP